MGWGVGSRDAPLTFVVSAVGSREPVQAAEPTVAARAKVKPSVRPFASLHESRPRQSAAMARRVGRLCSSQERLRLPARAGTDG